MSLFPACRSKWVQAVRAKFRRRCTFRHLWRDWGTLARGSLPRSLARRSGKIHAKKIWASKFYSPTPISNRHQHVWYFSLLWTQRIHSRWCLEGDQWRVPTLDVLSADQSWTIRLYHQGVRLHRQTHTRECIGKHEADAHGLHWRCAMSRRWVCWFWKGRGQWLRSPGII